MTVVDKLARLQPQINQTISAIEEALREPWVEPSKPWRELSIDEQATRLRKAPRNGNVEVNAKQALDALRMLVSSLP